MLKFDLRGKPSPNEWFYKGKALTETDQLGVVLRRFFQAYEKTCIHGFSFQLTKSRTLTLPLPRFLVPIPSKTFAP